MLCSTARVGSLRGVSGVAFIAALVDINLECICSAGSFRIRFRKI